MKKRILSLFLAVVMCLGMITTAYAVEPTVKLAVTADKTSAKVGEVVTFTVTCTSTKKLYGLEAKLDIPSGFTYIANSGALADGVVDEIGGTSDSKFLEANKHIWLENTTTPMTITGTVTLATFQCTASASGTSTVSLTGVSGVDDEFNSFTYSVAGVDVIVKAELTGDLPVTITKPAKGDTPETTISGTNFTGSITWSPAVAAGGKFAANTVYTAKVELTANTGYQFANGVNPTVAGSDSVTDVNVKDSGSKLEFKAFELPAGWSSEGWNPGNHYFHIAGEKYWVEKDGETLVHYAGQDNQPYTPPAQDGPDTRKRPDLANQVDVPNGKYLSSYNQFGYHIRSVLANKAADGGDSQ